MQGWLQSVIAWRQSRRGDGRTEGTKKRKYSAETDTNANAEAGLMLKLMLKLVELVELVEVEMCFKHYPERVAE